MPFEEEIVVLNNLARAEIFPALSFFLKSFYPQSESMRCPVISPLFKLVFQNNIGICFGIQPPNDQNGHE